MPHDPTKVPFNTTADASVGSAIYPVTPNDSADQLDAAGNYYKYFIALSAGDVAVLGYENADGDTAQVIPMQAGAMVPLRVRRVLSAGTTATLAGVTR